MKDRTKNILLVILFLGVIGLSITLAIKVKKLNDEKKKKKKEDGDVGLRSTGTGGGLGGPGKDKDPCGSGYEPAPGVDPMQPTDCIPTKLKQRRRCDGLTNVPTTRKDSRPPLSHSWCPHWPKK